MENMGEGEGKRNLLFTSGAPPPSYPTSARGIIVKYSQEPHYGGKA